MQKSHTQQLSHPSLVQFCCLCTLMQLHWGQHFCGGPSYSGRVKTLSDQIILKKGGYSHQTFVLHIYIYYIYIHPKTSFRDKDSISTFLRPFFLSPLLFEKGVLYLQRFTKNRFLKRVLKHAQLQASQQFLLLRLKKQKRLASQGN